MYVVIVVTMYMALEQLGIRTARSLATSISKGPLSGAHYVILNPFSINMLIEQLDLIP
jgi:hypothetical protein